MGEPVTVESLRHDAVAPPQLEAALRLAESLEPDDRLRLIVRLWTSLPPEHWAAPTAKELAEVARRLNDSRARRSVDPPWELVRQMLFKQIEKQPKASASPIYSAPRRFDLATVFIATTAYCVLFAGMTLLDVGPVIKLYVGAFITLVGAGQALLLSVMDARRASILVGASVHTIFSLVVFAIDSDYFFDSLIFAVVFNGMLFGSLLGYLAGVLAAGVFLVADKARGKMLVGGRSADQSRTHVDEPADESQQDSVVLTPVDSTATR